MRTSIGIKFMSYVSCLVCSATSVVLGAYFWQGVIAGSMVGIWILMLGAEE